MEWQSVPPREYVGDVREGDEVEVQVSPGIWVPARVIHDMDTRIRVKLDNPLLVITKTVTITYKLFSFKPVVTEEEKDLFTTTWASGRAYVRYPNRPA